ncbi:MAG: DNA translocase FtsK [Clostridia bacterium]|nr:DNA translocase FtsK [Clostridia bacterium]
MGLFGKSLVKDKWLGACIIISCVLIALVVHTAMTYNWKLDGYITRCFKSGEKLSTITATGWLGSLIVYPLAKLTTKVGALIILIMLALISIYVCVMVARRKKKEGGKPNTKPTTAATPSVDIPLSQPTVQNVQPQQQPVAANPQNAQPQPQQSAFPYANAVAQPENVVTPVNPTVVEIANTQNTQNAQPNFTGNIMPTVEQRPGVSLPETQPIQGAGAQPATSNVVAPFGNIQTMPMSNNAFPTAENTGTNNERSEYDYSNPRDFLFGGTPAENYRRNLLFDPNARVNNMPVTEQPNALGGTSGFMPSYSDSYQNTVNENTAPPRTEATPFSQRGSEYSFEDSRNERTGGEERSTITPMPTFEPQDRETDNSPYSLFEDRSSRDFAEERGGREEITFGREESFRNEPITPIVYEEWDRDYSAPDYKSLFSASNPNIFGGDENATRRFDDMVNSDPRFERGYREDSLSMPESERENTQNEDRNERDGFNLLDDDPYALRSDFEEDNRENNDFVTDSRDSRGNNDFVADNRDSRDEGISDSPRMGFGREETSFPEERTESENLFASRTEEMVAPAPVTPVQEPVAPVAPPVPVEPPKPEPPKPRIIRPYVRISLDDLDCRDIEPTSNFEEVEETKETIIATLEDFKIPDTSIASVTFGPTVARYNVLFPRYIQPKKVVALDQSIAISLRSNGVNVYPNYEDGVVSIEVPNKDRQFVQLGCMLSGDTYVNAKPSSLVFAMGKDVANRKVYGDISKMIHLLVAGSSGSGKSVFLGSLIISLIHKYSPEELRLILIDPKKTEFVLYNNLPHLMINEIITDASKAVQSLNWAIMEMNRRYSLFSQMSRSGAYVVNLDQYNAHVEKNQRLPKIVIIIDELADLMLAAKKEMEDRIQNLTQKARAAGIHLIVATQRPSTDVITGVIKSNLATRIAFYVASDVDSRVILDQSGAQKLLGKGDLLYTMPGVATPIRVQSAFISTEESQKVVNFIKANNEAYYDEEATNFINSRGGYAGDDSSSGGDGSGKDSGSVDPIYIEALRHVIACGSASISMIQRKCSAGYSRAGKIVEWMEEMGYISAFDGAKSRKVLISKEEFESKYGPLE